MIDIDREKRLEDEVRSRERHFRSILDMVPDAMIVIDEHGVMQFSPAPPNVNLATPKPKQSGKISAS